jgi:hypothetical protein
MFLCTLLDAVVFDRFWQYVNDTHKELGYNTANHNFLPSSYMGDYYDATFTSAALQVLGISKVTLEKCDFQVYEKGSCRTETSQVREVQMLYARAEPNRPCCVVMEECVLGRNYQDVCCGMFVFQGDQVLCTSAKCVLDRGTKVYQTASLVFLDTTHVTAQDSCVFHRGARLIVYPFCNLYMADCHVHVASSLGRVKVSKEALITTRNSCEGKASLNMFHLHFKDLVLHVPTSTNTELSASSKTLWAHEDAVMPFGCNQSVSDVVNRNAQVILHMQGKISVVFEGSSDAFCSFKNGDGYVQDIAKHRIQCLFESGLCLAQGIGLQDNKVCVGACKTRLYIFCGSDVTKYAQQEGTSLFFEKSGQLIADAQEFSQWSRAFRQVAFGKLGLKVDSMEVPAGSHFDAFDKIKQQLLGPVWNMQMENYFVINNMQVYVQLVEGMRLSQKMYLSSMFGARGSGSMAVKMSEDVLITSRISLKGSLKLSGCGALGSQNNKKFNVCMFAHHGEKDPLPCVFNLNTFHNPHYQGGSSAVQSMCVDVDGVDFDVWGGKEDFKRWFLVPAKRTPLSSFLPFTPVPLSGLVSGKNVSLTMTKCGVTCGADAATQNGCSVFLASCVVKGLFNTCLFAKRQVCVPPVGGLLSSPPPLSVGGYVLLFDEKAPKASVIVNNCDFDMSAWKMANKPDKAQIVICSQF